MFSEFRSGMSIDNHGICMIYSIVLWSPGWSRTLWRNQQKDIALRNTACICYIKVICLQNTQNIEYIPCQQWWLMGCFANANMLFKLLSCMQYGVVICHITGGTKLYDNLSILFILNYSFKLSETRWFRFCNYAPPWIFLPLDILF